MITRAKGHPRIEPDRYIALLHPVTVPLPDRHPVQPTAAPSLEVQLVTLLPVLIGHLLEHRLTRPRHEIANLGPLLPGILFIGEKPDHPSRRYQHIMHHAPTFVFAFQQHSINRFYLLHRQGGFDFP